MNTFKDDSPPSCNEVIGRSAPESSIINATGCETGNENHGRRHRVEQTNTINDNQGHFVQFNRGINVGQVARDDTSIDRIGNDCNIATNNGRRKRRYSFWKRPEFFRNFYDIYNVNNKN